MKEQWKINENNLAALEEGLQEGLQEEKQECETSCKQWLRYVRLIFLLEITLFLGWGCYMILETYRVRAITKNEITGITHERYPQIFGSLFEVQKSHPSRKMIFVKPEVILDKLHNILEDMELTEKQNIMQDKAIAIDIDNMVQSSMQHSINMQNNNMMKLNDVNSLLAAPSSRDLYDEKFKKNSMPCKTSSTGSIDETIDIDKAKGFTLYSIFEKMRNIIEGDNLEKIENKFEDSNSLSLDNQENKVLQVFNKTESKQFDVAMISDIENTVDRKITVNLTNNLQNSEQEFSDLVKDEAQNDRSDKSSFSDKIDEGINAHLEPDLVMCPPYQSHESSDMSSERSDKASSISQAVLTGESSEQIGNTSSYNIRARDEDKHDVHDNNMSMSGSSNVSVFGNDEHYTFDILVRISSDMEDQISSERSVNMKEEDESMEDIKNILKLFTKDSVETVTSNADVFQWYNAPAYVVDLFDQFKSEDVSKSRETEISFFQDEDDISGDIEVTYPNSENKCFMNIIMGILRVHCPGIQVDEEWNLTASEIDASYVPNVDDSEDIYNDYDYKEDATFLDMQWDDDFIFGENSNKNNATLQPTIPNVINVSELQENTSSAKAPNDTLNLSSMTEVNVLDHTEINQDDTTSISNEGGMQTITITSISIPESAITIDSSKEWNSFPDSSTSGIDTNVDVNEERNLSPETRILSIPVIGSGEEPNLSPETSDSKQQEQLKVIEREDSKNIETLSESYKIINSLKNKLTSIFNIEMPKIMSQQYPSESSTGQDNFKYNICSFYPYLCFSKHLCPQKYDDVRKSLEHIRNDDYNIRRKRMTKDLTWQQEQVSNALEEGNEKNLAILEKLRKLFQKMEILAACIDKLHERYLLHNKLDEDYVSSEFPMETEEHQVHL